MYNTSMRNTSRGSTFTIVIITMVVIVTLYFLIPMILHSYNEGTVNKQRKESFDKYISTLPELTTDQARTLVIETWGDCTQDKCGELIVTTEKKADGWYVTAIYDKLRDDSVGAERKIAQVKYLDGVWLLGNPSMSHSCQKNRGHQDFSNELCI